MHIKEIISQNRRDFRAIYKCEHCNKEVTLSGYDDANFHDNVIPDMKCTNPKCKKTASANYEPRDTKYDASEII